MHNLLIILIIICIIFSVECIEPKLKKEYVNELSIVEDSSGQSKVSDITLFLYQLRSIFLKYFITTGKSWSS